MTQTLLYAPDGQPLLTAGKSVAGHVVDDEVAKRVRSQGVSMTSIWDRNRGKPKPTPVTWETLRLMSHRNEWVRAIIKTRKNQIGRKKWKITPLDKDDQSGSTVAACEKVTKLFRRPTMYGSRPHSRSWRQWIGELLEDLLVLDAACVEKERNGRSDIVALYPVDGATIRPNIDEDGGYYDDAYVQVVDGVITARFGMEDLVYVMDNPQTDVRFAGYGMSPLENLIVSVTAELYASKFNSSYFEKGSVPEGLLNLGEDVAPEDVDAFRLYWMNEVMGKPWAIPIFGGSKGVEWQQWRDNNRDMQFMEYQSWLLKKLCAVYQIAPQEVGELEDVNRSTADDQGDVNESKSIEPVTSLLKDYFDVEIIGEHGMGLGDWIEFEWEETGESAEQINAKYQPMVDDGAATRAEWREAQGMDQPDDDVDGAEGLEMFLAAGEVQPLPSKEDAEVMGAKNQQEREDQQQQADQQAQQGGGPADMDWSKGDENDPATRAAMRQHDDEHGIGPRQKGDQGAFGKTSPYGRDRNPHLTRRSDEFEQVFEDRREVLAEGLAELLQVPLAEVEELV